MAQACARSTTATEVELRPVFEADDFGAEFTPELREQEERQRAAIEVRAKGRDTAIEGAAMATIQRITPCLWFDGQAEAAADFYVSIFPNSRITAVSRYGEAGREIHGGQPARC